MKFSEQWLRAWVNPKVDTKTLADQLTMAGLEVDAVEPAAPDFQGVVVGSVLSATPHPDAKRLRCCKVDVGDKEPVDIVCGGVNVREGLKVPVAKVGAVLPGDFKIKKAKLRGEPSHGMICSSKELGLGDGAEGGIMELREDAPIGTDFREYLELDDHVIDIELTPNRGDCLSLRGIAHEVAVINELEWSPIVITPQKASIKADFPVDVIDEKACPRYAGRVIQGIHSDAITPLWMEERLRRSGLRCIHPVVDVLNYVMLEIGQPMHAFDLKKLNEKIIVRPAKKGERVTLLDEQEAELVEGSLVIADAKSVIAIAGVMGGLDSAVTASTTDIFLESAFFDLLAIRKSAKDHGLQTDSSYRFERGVDFEMQVEAIERATELLLTIVGGEAGPVIEVASEKHLPEAKSISFRSSEIKRQLGIALDDTQIEKILLALGMEVHPAKDGWMIGVPTYRFDIEREVDLVEEIARIYGYDQIPAHAMQLEGLIPAESESNLLVDRIAKAMVDQGYHEAITYSFVSEEMQQYFDPEKSTMKLANPLASDMSVMRTSLWPGLVKAVMHNVNRQTPRVRLFEVGMCFESTDKECIQKPMFGMAATGDIFPEQWGETARSVDFFDMKRDVELLLALTGLAHYFSWEKKLHPALHSGQSAAILYKNQPVGYLGVMHPKLADKLDLSGPVCLFEIELEVLQAACLPAFSAISKFPAVRRDVAMILDQAVSADALKSAVRESAGQLLSNVELFDVYQGKGIETGKKSVALGLTFQDPSRTLVDQEINDVIHNVVATLERKFNATLRA